jgi:hypothetical protein
MRNITILGALFVLTGCAATSEEGVAGNEHGNGGGGGWGASGTGGGGGDFPNGPLTVSVLDAHATLSDTKAEVAVVLSSATNQTVNVTLDTVDGTATVSAGDYQAVHQTVTFAPGVKKVVVLIPVVTPYKKLGLETSLSRELAVKLSNPVGVTIADGDGRVTLAHAGMVIETPLAQNLFDGDILPDFNGDKKADLLLTGNSKAAAVLVTPKTVFEEAAHVVVDDAYLAGGEAGFTYPVSTSYTYWGSGFVMADASMSWDVNGDGFSDAIVVSDGKARFLYGHAGPFQSFAVGDPRLANGTDATELSDLWYGYGGGAIQTGDWDGDGVRDFAQANYYSSAAGGSDSFDGYYGLPGGYPGVYAAPSSFSFLSGTTPVGQASLSNGANAGVTGDFNGDGIDDFVFVGISANDTLFGGCYMYVRFCQPVRFNTQNAQMKGTLDGKNGFHVSHDDYLTSSHNYVPQDSGDVNGDGVDDLVLTGGGKPLTVIFGKKTPFAAGSYAKLADLGSEAAIFDTDDVVGARVGDINRDGIGDIVFITENKLRILWGKQGLTGKPIFGTQYPEVGEIEIEPTSTLDDVSIVGDIDGDDTADVVILSNDWKGSGGALILFGSTLTRIFGGPNLDLPQIE